MGFFFLCHLNWQYKTIIAYNYTCTMFMYFRYIWLVIFPFHKSKLKHKTATEHWVRTNQTRQQKSSSNSFLFEMLKLSWADFASLLHWWLNWFYRGKKHDFSLCNTQLLLEYIILMDENKRSQLFFNTHTLWIQFRRYGFPMFFSRWSDAFFLQKSL